MGYGEKLAFRNDLGGNHFTLAQPRGGKGLDPSFVPRQKPGLITNTAKRAMAYIFVFGLIATVMLMQMKDNSDPNEPELALVKKKPAPLRKDPREQEVVLGKPKANKPTGTAKEDDSKIKVNARKGAPAAEPTGVPDKKAPANSKDTKPLKSDGGKAVKANKAEAVNNKAKTQKKLQDLEDELEEQEDELEEDLEEVEDYMEANDAEEAAEARAAAAAAAAGGDDEADLAEKLGKKRPASEAQAKALEAKALEDAKAAKFKEERAKQDKVKAQQKQVRDEDGEYEGDEEVEEEDGEEEEEGEDEIEIEDAKIAKALL